MLGITDVVLVITLVFMIQMNDREFCLWVDKYATHIGYISIIIAILIYASEGDRFEDVLFFVR